MGPQGYVSPSWMRDRTQAPTWNYATVHMDVEVALEDNNTATDNALSKLVAHMERNRTAAWSALDMGDRYARLATAVVAFRARVISTTAKFKLGQNERRDVFNDILRGLRATGQNDLAQAMQSTESANASK
jgi:transcriptional regulator